MFHPSLTQQKPASAKGIRELVAELESNPDNPLFKAAEAIGNAVESLAGIMSRSESILAAGQALAEDQPGGRVKAVEDRPDKAKGEKPQYGPPVNPQGNTHGYWDFDWEVIKYNLQGGGHSNPDTTKGDPRAFPNGGFYMPPESAWDEIMDWFDQLAHGDNYDRENPDKADTDFHPSPHGGTQRVKQFGPQGAAGGAGFWATIMKAVQDMIDAAAKEKPVPSGPNGGQAPPAAPAPGPTPLLQSAQDHVDKKGKAGKKPHLSAYEKLEAEYLEKQKAIHERHLRDLFGHSHWENQFGEGESERQGISQVDLSAILRREAGHSSLQIAEFHGRIEQMISELLKEIRHGTTAQIQEHQANVYRLAALGY